MPEYFDKLSDVHRNVLAYYEQKGLRILRKERPKGLGITYGYRIQKSSLVSTASIGKDEITIFHDLSRIIKPKATFIIGHGFGLSSLVVALSHPGGSVLSIDNWSHANIGGYLYKLAKEMQEEIPNLFVYTGSSPKDSKIALTHFGIESLSLVFIDGMHTDQATFEDFHGVFRFLEPSSVVLWHNAQDTWDGINLAWRKHGRTLFSRKYLLFSWGPLAIFFNEKENPNIMQYLDNRCLIWKNWQAYLKNIQTINLNRKLRENFVIKSIIQLRRKMLRKD